MATPSLGIGVVGLGNMGFRMAVNLIRAGHRVAVHDLRSDMLEKLSDQGAEIVDRPSDLADERAKLDVIMTMLPSSSSVESVYLGDGGLLRGASVGPKLMLDTSTVAPATSRKVAEAGKAKGVTVLDAPVSGGVVGAAAATLTFMVGGDERAFERAQPVLGAMGSKSVYCGAAGSGQAVKLCNNLALAIQMASIAESIKLGQQLGLDAKVLSDVMNTSSARCWSVDTYNPCPGVMKGVPASRDYEGGFGCSLMIKDLNLALEAAQLSAADGRGAAAQLPMGASALELYQRMAAEGERASQSDFGGIFKYIYNGEAHAPSAE